MNVLALDQARHGGWSVFNYDTKELVAYGTFAFEAKDYTYAKAILEIKRLVISLIDKYEVAAVFLEDVQLRANAQAFKKLAQLQGVLVNLCEENEYLYVIIPPSCWQNFCKARGRNTKEVKSNIQELANSDLKESKILSIQFIKDKFGIHTNDDNLADAICIGYYAVSTVEIVRTPEIKE